TVENIKAGDYPIVRPFNVVTGSELSDLAKDFITFIMSKEGQDIISGEGYISNVDNPAEYVQQNGLTGRIVLAGSTSVAPVMEVLADAYKEMYSGVEIEIQQTGSGAGITSTIEGACDIGMASRDLKDEETAKGVEQTQIALDGIAVIVNTENSVDDLSTEQIRSIFTGETTTWE
ncbi:MAG: substrate-binding domain-containing protein, partial [Anaerovoracaceae bacterium]